MRKRKLKALRAAIKNEKFSKWQNWKLAIDYGTPDQPATLTYRKKHKRIRAVLTVTRGRITEMDYAYSDNNGKRYHPLGKLCIAYTRCGTLMATVWQCSP